MAVALLAEWSHSRQFSTVRILPSALFIEASVISYCTWVRNERRKTKKKKAEMTC